MRAPLRRLAITEFNSGRSSDVIMKRGWGRVCVAAAAATLFSVAGWAEAAPLPCDDGIKKAFRPDANTTVVSVRAFTKGAAVPAAAYSRLTPAPPVTAAGDLCLVKLLVGPGATAEKDKSAPSWSEGIGIEVWLPAAWNQRIRNSGGGGWAGGAHRYPDQIGSSPVAIAIANMGYAVGTTDTGHAIQDASFAFLSNGKLNEESLNDFLKRSLVELAVKTKALVTMYYGAAPRFVYWEGYSQGAIQGLKIAQEQPELYDGYLVGAPGLSGPRFGVAALYPQLVMKKELGFTAIDRERVNAFLKKAHAANVRAVKSCDKEGLGFILDPFSCTYEPLADPDMLCSGEEGRGAKGKNSDAATCMSAKEAGALARIWHGPTSDGSWDPDQPLEARRGLKLGAKQWWWGPTRGSVLPPRIQSAYTDNVALSLQSVEVASDASATSMPLLKNSSTTVRNRWLDLDYSTFAQVPEKALKATAYAPYMTDKTDLSKLRALGRKVIFRVDLSDALIPPAGNINYYHRVTQAMGGVEQTQAFMRLYLVPGAEHDGQGRGYAPAGKSEAVPLVKSPGIANQTPTRETDQLHSALVDWVEKGIPPGEVVITSRDGSVSYPICVWPRKTTWNGTGSSKEARNYSCR